MTHTPYPKLTEADVTKQITDLMTAKGWRCMRLQSGVFVADNRIVRVGETGMVDWCFMRRSDDPLRPYVIFVEVKAPGKSPTPKQLAWIGECNAAGLVATWTDDIDDFVRWLKEHGL